MIPRDRKGTQVPAVLLEPDGVGRKEREEILGWIAGARRDKRPTFRAYKAREVVTALEVLFERKCAYCESVYVATQPIDVEHWRPKAEVEVVGPTGSTMRHGYEWLAMEWHNLLPSCIDCNRARGQVVLPGDSHDKVVKQTSGKANQFPVADEQQRLASPTDDVTRERPLLIDPCELQFDGTSYFEFRDNGVVGPRDAASSRLPAAQTRRARALDSIRVYALNRKALVEARRERLLLVQARCELIRSLIAITERVRAVAATATTEGPLLREVAGDLHVLFEKELASLAGLAASHQPYSLMVQQFVDAFRDELLAK